nr:hypothetical protein [Prosthecomicrobium hirschii]
MEAALDGPEALEERIEGLLHLVRTGIQLVEEQAIGLVARDQGRRAEARLAVDDLRHADDVFRGQLRAEQGDAGQADRFREAAHQRRLADAGRPPDEDRHGRRDIEEKRRQGRRCQDGGGFHGGNLGNRPPGPGRRNTGCRRQ